MRCPFSVFLCPFCFDEWHRIRSAIITKVLEFQPLWPIRILKWGSLAIFKLAYIWFMCGWKVLHIHFVYGWKIIHIHLLSRLWMTLVWEEIFHATNGKAQACTQGALLSFLLSLGGKWFSFIFPWFPTCSHNSCNENTQMENMVVNIRICYRIEHLIIFWPLAWLDDTSFLFHKVFALWYKIVQRLQQQKLFYFTKTCYTITNSLCPLSRFSFFSKISLDHKTFDCSPNQKTRSTFI
jgi:hypothetical protein